MTGRYIAIAGNIGVGKSSLLEFLCQRFGIKPFFERNATNPYLEDFYKDMKSWAFHSQIYFLSEKFKIHQELAKSTEAVVQDRTIFEDAEIFATNLYKTGFISEREFAVYQSFYQSIVRAIRPPDLLIYLKCNVGTMKKRVAKRGRAMEKTIPEDYLKQLNALYERWIKRYDLSPVLVYPTDKLDYLSDFIHQRDLMEQIEKYL